MLIGLSIALFHSLAEAQETGPALDITVVQSKASYLPGDTVLIALDVAIPAKYHLYGNPLGPGIGKPLTIVIRGGEGIDWLDVIKSVPKKFTPEVGGWVYAYEKQAIFCLRGVARNPAQSAGLVKGTVVLSGLACFTSCYPVYYELPIWVAIDPRSAESAPFVSEKRFARFLEGKTETMSFEKEPAVASPLQLNGSLGNIGGISAARPAWDYTPREGASDFNVWAAIFFAFLAGILLNAMPCVLPVLGIKILSFANTSGKGRKDAVIHSAVFSSGVVSVFMVLAALASFASFSWGRQFQEPGALVGIITLIVLFSLGMFDVYMINVPGSISGLDRRKSAGMVSEFFKGIFATVLATPCSGPFLGAVLAWAVSQPPYVIFVVYGSIGAGMILPYIVLSSSSRAARLIPRPGPWMNVFKGFMGFLLLGFAVYLTFGLPDALAKSTVLFCLFAALAAVIYGRFAPFGASAVRKLAIFAAGVAIAAGGLYVSFFMVYPSFSLNKAETAREESSVWKPFNPDSLIAAHDAGRTVIVDFTASWCMNCQYNTIMVLSKKEVIDAIRKTRSLALVVDMTTPDPLQDELLRKLGSRSIPFLAIFPGKDPGHPIVMRDLLTKGGILKELKKLK